MMSPIPSRTSSHLPTRTPKRVSFLSRSLPGFVATSSFPAVKRPSRASSVPRETYVFPRETRRRRRWTAEEESRLTQGVHTYGEGQWAAIRRHMRLTSRSNVELKVGDVGDVEDRTSGVI